MNLQVFIQCEAGSTQKHIHDEKTLEWQRTVTVPAAYPFPYGFILETTGADGGNIDCFVITRQPLKHGQVIAGEPIGLMEQFEGDEIDHKVLAKLVGEEAEVNPSVQEALTEFIYRLFSHFEELQVRVGLFLSSDQAEAFISAGRIG